MTSQAHNPRLFKTSLYAMFLSAILMTGFIACSDIQDSGITNREVEHAQAEMLKSGDAGSPLYVLNGEVIERIDPPDALSRIKTKYIEHIEVIKGRKAIEEYGEKGKNGVIKLTLIDKEKALNDLKDAPAGNAASRAEKGEDFFVVVEKMPKLKGGMVQLQNCVEYPREAKEAGIEGRVIVQFIVNENGQVENPNIIRGIGGGADEEALRCVEQAEFEPGKQRGQPVRVQFSMPIIFKLTDSQSIEKEESSAYFESYKVEGKIMELRDLTLSEDGILRGTVYDRSKEVPLAGANVVLQSLQRGAATGPDGQFTLRGIDSKNGIPKIRISYTGYRSITAEIQ